MLTLILSSVAMMLILAILMKANTLTIVVTGMKQIVLGALDPSDYGRHLIKAMSDFVEEHHFSNILMMTVLKCLSCNLLPLKYFNGGDALFRLFKPSKFDIHYEKISVTITVFLFLSWFYTLLRFVIEG